MAKGKDDDRGAKGKDQADKRTFNPPKGPAKESQHDQSDHDEKGRMGQFGGAGEHPRDTGKGRRGT